MIYSVRVNLTLEADSQSEAIQMAAACVEYWDEHAGLDNVSGVGGAVGWVEVKQLDSRNQAADDND